MGDHRGRGVQRWAGWDARLQVIESELHERDKTGPEIKRKGDVYRGESGDDVIFGGAHASFGRVGTVIVGRGKLNNAGDRRFVVGDNIFNDVA
jgi:hypothetical protein